MKNISAWLLLGFLAASIAVPVAMAERFEYTSHVNRWIPDSDSTGIRDTIFVLPHINIDDINIFLGISEGIVIEVQNDIYSPSRYQVTLNGWGGEFFGFYFFWYDTDRPEDGPGELEDYAGTDAYGNWELYCYDPFEDHTSFWEYWRIEIYGELMTGIEGNETNSLIPRDYLLKEAYPNPFNSSTMIEFGLPVESHVKIEIYDILGRLCKTLIDAEMPAGYHQVQWNGADGSNQPVASGIYLVKMTAGVRQLTNRAVLVK